MKKLFDKIKKNNKGFTLVELIVVIAVLAVITVVAAPQYIKYVEKSKVGTDENAIGEIAHIAEIQWVELKAQDVIKAGQDGKVANMDVTVTCGAVGSAMTVGTSDLEKSIAEIAGEYKVKSDTYSGKSVTITLNSNGVATWNKLSTKDVDENTNKGK